jgi:hypothetical protein
MNEKDSTTARAETRVVDTNADRSSAQIGRRRRLAKRSATAMAGVAAIALLSACGHPTTGPAPDPITVPAPDPITVPAPDPTPTPVTDSVPVPDPATLPTTTGFGTLPPNALAPIGIPSDPPVPVAPVQPQPQTFPAPEPFNPDGGIVNSQGDCFNTGVCNPVP